MKIKSFNFHIHFPIISYNYVVLYYIIQSNYLFLHDVIIQQLGLHKEFQKEQHPNCKDQN